MKLTVLYEDDDIIVCFKPSGIAVQSAGLASADMVSILKNYLAGKEKVKDPYVGVIHRLDQPVSGILVFAKNKKAAAKLSRQIQDSEAGKDYIALCYKVPDERKGTLIHYIRKDPAAKRAVVTDEITLKKNRKNEQKDPSYKKAVLRYETQREGEECAVLKIHLQTGRYHQIRAQFAALGNALLGDVKYGTVESKELSEKMGIRTVALCAYSLAFHHPATGKEMNFVLDKEYLPQWYNE